jgi:hypothetical protein
VIFRALQPGTGAAVVEYVLTLPAALKSFSAAVAGAVKADGPAAFSSAVVANAKAAEPSSFAGASAVAVASTAGTSLPAAAQSSGSSSVGAGVGAAVAVAALVLAVVFRARLRAFLCGGDADEASAQGPKVIGRRPAEPASAEQLSFDNPTRLQLRAPSSSV